MHILLAEYSGPSNFERFDVRIWNWNKKIRGKFGFETRTKTPKSNKESRARHLVATWSPTLSAWSHVQLLGQFSGDWVSDHLANSVFFKRFIYVFGLFLYNL
jgi:hypothetical protein